MKKTRGFKKKIKNSKVKFYIGDVRDYRSVSEAVKGVDYIFHAAALKQVPLVNSFLLRLLKLMSLVHKTFLRQLKMNT